ncbi:MAG TPA: sialidase family protein [Thermoplasmata archaeon]|nr:sialidase family protein [Thermoplasmata archaeon]
MTELTTKPRASPFTTSQPFLGIVGLLVLFAVLGMPLQGAVHFGPGTTSSASAPTGPAGLSHTGHGLTIAPSVLNSPLGQRTLGLTEALAQPRAPGIAGLAPILGHLLPQTAPPKGASAHPTPSYSGGVNNYVQTSDCQGWGFVTDPTGGPFVPTIGGSSIAQMGSSNQTLIAGGGSLYDIFNVSGAALCNSGGLITQATVTYGYSNVFLSNDGGASWNNVTIPANTTHWENSADQANGSMSSGNDVVAAAPNGLALEMSGYAPLCLAVPINPPLTCGSSLGEAAPWGYAVTRSTNNGSTWGQWAQVSAAPEFNFYTFAAACGLGTAPVLEGDMISEHPTLATNGTYAVASWDMLDFTYNLTACTIASETATVQASYSWDGGLTWSAPVNVSGPVSENPTLHYGPAPAYTLYDVFTDVSSANVSTSNQVQFQWTKSTDGGKVWTALGSSQQIGKWNVNPTCFGCATVQDSIYTIQWANFAVDNWTASPDSGNLYIVWQDNGTGSNSGEVSVAFERSTTGGQSWSASKDLTVPSTSLHYLEPAVTVAPNGNVWVTYYGFGTSSGYYNLFGVLSTDGGATWSPQFLLSSAESTPPSTLQDIGYYMGGTGTSAGFLPIWSDCRSSACSTGYDVQLYTATVNALNISTNATVPITAQVTVFGVTSAVPLPVNTGVDWGTSVTVSVPSELPDVGNPNDVLSFTGWSGLTQALNPRTTFTYDGTGSLVAGYTAVPAAFIAGTLWPNQAGASVTIDQVPVLLTAFNSTAYQYSVSVPTGQPYYVNASETKYITQNAPPVPVEAGKTTWQNFTLQRQTGFLTGVITPFTAYLTLNATIAGTGGINETSQINPLNGQFSIVVPWGQYWLNASKPGLTSATCQGHEVIVTPGAATTCNFPLVGGWIYGAVGPASPKLVIKVDGVALTSQQDVDGVFNVSVIGGYHNLTTTEKGYNLSFFPTIYVKPGHATAVNVTLTDLGWITGVISPVAALKTPLYLAVTNGSLGGPKTYNPTTGAFNVSVKGPINWTITATANGYNKSVAVIYVTPGNGTLYNIQMNQSVVKPPTCPPTCPQQNNSNSSSSGFPLIDLIGIVVVIVIVAVIAMAMLMRRRSGGQGGQDGDTPPPPDETYQGTNPADLAKLQSDGTMGEANPPPP